MKAVSGIIAAVALLAAGQALAAPAPKEATTCMACHDVAVKKVGPTYKDIAKKYASAAGAVDTLTKKVIVGGTGVWGQIPMPPRGASPLKDDEIKKVVAWIMTQK